MPRPPARSKVPLRVERLELEAVQADWAKYDDLPSSTVLLLTRAVAAMLPGIRGLDALPAQRQAITEQFRRIVAGPRTGRGSPGEALHEGVLLGLGMCRPKGVPPSKPPLRVPPDGLSVLEYWALCEDGMRVMHSLGASPGLEAEIPWDEWPRALVSMLGFGVGCLGAEPIPTELAEGHIDAYLRRMLNRARARERGQRARASGGPDAASLASDVGGDVLARYALRNDAHTFVGAVRLLGRKAVLLPGPNGPTRAYGPRRERLLALAKEMANPESDRGTVARAAYYAVCAQSLTRHEEADAVRLLADEKYGGRNAVEDVKTVREDLRMIRRLVIESALVAGSASGAFALFVLPRAAWYAYTPAGRVHAAGQRLGRAALLGCALVLPTSLPSPGTQLSLTPSQPQTEVATKEGLNGNGPQTTPEAGQLTAPESSSRQRSALRDDDEDSVSFFADLKDTPSQASLVTQSRALVSEVFPDPPNPVSLACPLLPARGEAVLCWDRDEFPDRKAQLVLLPSRDSWGELVGLRLRASEEAAPTPSQKAPPYPTCPGGTIWGGAELVENFSQGYLAITTPDADVVPVWASGADHEQPQNLSNTTAIFVHAGHVLDLVLYSCAPSVRMIFHGEDGTRTHHMKLDGQY